MEHKDLIGFLDIARKLKDVKRTGWVERGVADPESVSDHSFMMALMCMAIDDAGIDKDRAIKMALVHDIAEAEVGDLITTENWKEKGTISNKDKLVLERGAIKDITAPLGSDASEEIIGLWDEFHEGKTQEAVFVKDLDNAERILQAVIYHQKGNFKKPLEGFWEKWDLNKISNKRLKKIVLDVIKGPVDQR